MKTNILDAQRQIVKVSLQDIRILGVLPDEVKIIGVVDIGFLDSNDKMPMNRQDYRKSFGVVVESSCAHIAPAGAHYMWEPIQDFLRRWVDMTKSDGSKVLSELVRLGL